MIKTKEILPDRLVNNYDNKILQLSANTKDLTKGLNFPKCKIATIGKIKKVRVFYYEGKPDFYINRPIRNYNAVIQYQPRLDLTLIAIKWVTRTDNPQPGNVERPKRPAYWIR